MIGRLGGEEFGIVLPESSVQEAALTAERLRKTVEGQKYDVVGNEFYITVSVGVAQLKTGESGHELLIRADAAMYAAKRNGRNRVEIA